MLSAGTSAWLVLLSHCSLPQRTETNIYPGRLLCIYSTAAFSSVNKYGGYRFPSINKYIGLPLFRSPLRNVLCTCLLFVSSVCVFRFLLIYSYFFLSLLCPFMHGKDVLCWLLSCPLSSVCFPCFSSNVFPV